MNELPDEAFEEAIRATHGTNSKQVEAKQVIQRFRGREVWRGTVLTFALEGHPTAKLCYAWSVDGRVTAVLHEGPVDSPEAAVRAAIASEYRNAQDS